MQVVFLFLIACDLIWLNVLFRIRNLRGSISRLRNACLKFPGSGFLDLKFVNPVCICICLIFHWAGFDWIGPDSLFLCLDWNMASCEPHARPGSADVEL